MMSKQERNQLDFVIQARLCIAQHSKKCSISNSARKSGSISTAMHMEVHNVISAKSFFRREVHPQLNHAIKKFLHRKPSPGNVRQIKTQLVTLQPSLSCNTGVAEEKKKCF